MQEVNVKEAKSGWQGWAYWVSLEVVFKVMLKLACSLRIGVFW